MVNVPAVLVGRVFTHRLTAEEIDRDELATVPDFAGIWPLLDGAPFDVLDDQPIEDAIDDATLQPVIRLDAGTLAGYPADSLIAISVTPDGLHLESAPEPEEPISCWPRRSGSSKSSWRSSATTCRELSAEYEWDDELDVEENLPTAGAVRGGPGSRSGADWTDAAEPVGAIPLEEFLLLACVRHPDLFTDTGLAGDRHPGPATARSRGRHGGGVRF